MSVQLRSRVHAVVANFGATGRPHNLPLDSWLSRGALAAASLAAVCFADIPTASAVPSYARQTGQPCATCHTAFPELTPYGRQFKLMGYTSGGTRCNDGSAKSDETQVPLALMSLPATFTGVKNSANQAAMGQASNISNDAWYPGQQSVFVAGQLYCDVGAFAQMTYDPVGKVFTWDNVDIRYAKTGVINGTSVVYGITANNNPSVQDAWNTAPAWVFPYMDTAIGPAPAFGTMLGTSAFGQQVGGAGAYVWINSSIYAEFSAYGNLSRRELTNLNGGFDGTVNRFDGMAPYWRLAYEKTWDKNSLMFGTSGMYANQKMGVDAQTSDQLNSLFKAGVTDPTLNIGFDTQYQWIGEEHAVTLRAAYIWQRKKNTAENAALAEVNAGVPNTYQLANTSDTLNDFNISASYIYDRKISFTAGYFNTWGTTDVGLYQNAIGTSANGSPDSRYYKFDLAYLPFMNGGPDIWPWFNARIGIQYTHYDKFDGTWNNVDGSGLKAGGNDTVYVYTWLMF
jgi:hypothetical protein